MEAMDRFLAALPAGEWGEVSVVGNPDGMMAAKGWTLLANARSLRHGGRPAFLKCTFVAGPHAGMNTNLLTGRPRLERLRERLLELQGHPDVPAVRIYEAVFLLNGEALLVAMEAVTPLDDIIKQRGADDRLAIDVLKQCNPVHLSPHCHHFDLCPRNMAQAPDGRIVFIDLDSLYLPEANRFQVTVPVCKPFRLPAAVIARVVGEMEANQMHIQIPTARVKQAFDVVLTAAECSLGGLPITDPTANLTESWLDALPDVVAPELRRKAVFWSNELRDAIRTGVEVDVSAVLERFVALTENRTTVTPASPIVVEPSREEPPPAAAQQTAIVGEFDQAWQRLKPTAQALRRDRLARPEIAAYRAQLETMKSSHANEPRLWHELLLVAMSYEKDPAVAMRLVDEATRALPQDPELRRWRNVIHMWASE